jgi:cytochrome c-type biogenesis protein CcmH
MTQYLKPILILTLLVALMPAFAVFEVKEFSSEAKRDRYHKLAEELRCPKCQNQSFAGSDSPIAQDLRRELYRLVEQGRSEAEIKAFMVQRYGDYVLYKPPVQRNTWLLWWGPPAIFGIAAIAVVLIVWRRRRLIDAEASLSEEDQAQLDRLLREAEDDDQNNDKADDRTSL